MKVKNIMFSGFAAAVFATVCGAAVAADVSLISKDYADAKLQAKLTEGQGIEIAEQADGTTTISANVDLTNLATKSEATYQGEGYVSVDDNKITVTADGEVAAGNTGLVTGGAVHTITSALDTRLGTAEGDIDALQADMGDVPEAGWTISSTNTKNVSEAITLLEGKVADVASTEGLNALEKNVATNTANIALKANSADVYTKDEVDIELGKKQNELTAANVVSGSQNVQVGFENGVYTISATDNNTEYGIGTATTEGLTKLYTATGEAEDGTMTQAAIKVALDGKLATDGTAAMATADANGANIADTYATKAVVASKLSSIKTAGSYLVNFGADGNVSYAPIQILGSNGQPITLTGENAVAPSEN